MKTFIFIVFAAYVQSSFGDKCTSPINIATCETDEADIFSRVLEHNYKIQPTGKYTLKNTGDAVELDLGDNQYHIFHGVKKYTPKKVVYHFDAESAKGSEHALNGKKFLGEIQIVHENVRRWSWQSKSYFVVSMFMNLANGDVSKEVEAMAKLAGQVNKPGSSVEVNAFPLEKVFPKDPRKKAGVDYVSYTGTMPSGKCEHKVEWVVLTGYVVNVNEKILNELRKINIKNPAPPMADLDDRAVRGVHGMF